MVVGDREEPNKKRIFEIGPQEQDLGSKYSKKQLYKKVAIYSYIKEIGADQARSWCYLD